MTDLLKPMLQLILKMEGLMPESTRYALMMNVVTIVTDMILKNDGYSAVADYQQNGEIHQFMLDCNIKSGPGHVCTTVSANDSALAVVINRWSNMEGLSKDQILTRDGILSDLKAIMESDYDEECN